MACAICGTASMSTRPARNLPSNSPDRVSRSSASCALSGILDREKNTSSTGAFIDVSTMDWKFCSVISTQ